MITILEATKEKAAIITGLMHDAFRSTEPPSSALLETEETVRERLEKGDEQAAIAAIEGKAVGMVRFQVREDEVCFFRLSVDPEQQGKGIGGALLAWVEEYARAHGKRALVCRVRMEIEKNVKLYLKAGFQITSQEIVERPNTPSIPTAYMRKNLP